MAVHAQSNNKRLHNRTDEALRFCVPAPESTTSVNQILEAIPTASNGRLRINAALVSAYLTRHAPQDFEHRRAAELWRESVRFCTAKERIDHGADILVHMGRFNIPITQEAYKALGVKPQLEQERAFAFTKGPNEPLAKAMDASFKVKKGTYAEKEIIDKIIRRVSPTSDPELRIAACLLTAHLGKNKPEMDYYNWHPSNLWLKNIRKIPQGQQIKQAHHAIACLKKSKSLAVKHAREILKGAKKALFVGPPKP
ncbi:MAG TPA: hypothetical protein DD400_02265 [Rhodospirillaceae bacterium]|nr:hypothetical protein [Rhodospirillaceae bacterium]